MFVHLHAVLVLAGVAVPLSIVALDPAWRSRSWGEEKARKRGAEKGSELFFLTDLANK